MEYNFREQIEELLLKGRRTKKSLYDFLGMSMQGFDAMMKNNSFSAIRLAKVAEFFEIDVSELYGSSSPKTERINNFGGEVTAQLSKEIAEELKGLREQLVIKDRQIEGLQRTVDVLVGKSEGATVVPLSDEEKIFYGRFHEYVGLVMGSNVSTGLVKEKSKPVGKVGGTPLAYGANTVTIR